MNKLLFNTETFLSKKDLVEGNAYIFKDGRLGYYLGKEDFKEKFVFYIVASVYFCRTDKYYTNTLAHYNTQVKYLVEMGKEVKKETLEMNSLIVLSTMPKIIGVFPYVKIENIDLWYNKQRLVNSGLPQLVKRNEVNKNSLYVKAQDLEEGNLYYTSQLWRALYIYLGRDKEKNFCWFFVGNEYILFKTRDINEIIKNSFRETFIRTKTNKKCKRLFDAPQDTDVFIYDEAKKLIDMGWKADMSNFNLNK